MPMTWRRNRLVACVVVFFAGTSCAAAPEGRVDARREGWRALQREVSNPVKAISVGEASGQPEKPSRSKDDSAWESEKRAKEEKRRAESGWMTIGAQASRTAAARCGQLWTESPSESSGSRDPIAICEELRTRDVGDPDVCWVGSGAALAAGGLSVERDPYSFTSAPRDCFSIRLTTDERKSCEDSCRAAAHEAARVALAKSLDDCLAEFVGSGPGKAVCELQRPSSRAYLSQEEVDAKRASCTIECKKGGPLARAKAAAEKTREGKEAAGRGKRDACVRTCESAAERKCEGLPERGLVGQKSLCLRDALVACCGSCGVGINTTNYSMCIH